MRRFWLTVLACLLFAPAVWAQATITSIPYDQPPTGDNYFGSKCEPGVAPLLCREEQLLTSSGSPPNIVAPTWGSIPVTPTMTPRKADPATTPARAEHCLITARATNAAGCWVTADASGYRVYVSVGDRRAFPARWNLWPTPGLKDCSYLTLQSACYDSSNCASATSDVCELQGQY